MRQLILQLLITPLVLLGILTLRLAWGLLLLILVPCVYWARFWHAVALCNYQDCTWTVAWWKARRRYP